MQITQNLKFSCTKDSNFTKRKTIKIYETLIIPFATYGAKCWTLQQDIAKRLATLEILKIYIKTWK